MVDFKKSKTSKSLIQQHWVLREAEGEVPSAYSTRNSMSAWNEEIGRCEVCQVFQCSYYRLTGKNGSKISEDN